MEKRILLSHGEGGRRTHELISKVILKYFTSPELEQLADSAILPLPDEGKLVFTTDSHVVDPIFFPGGDIGRCTRWLVDTTARTVSAIAGCWIVCQANNSLLQDCRGHQHSSDSG